MLKNSSKNQQLNLFHSPLIALSDTIDWQIFEDAFAKYYSDEGRPAKPIRLMVGILLLKQLENLSDENIVLQWKRNPYYQYFCGLNELQIIEPCHATDLVYFRKRIGTEGMKVIFGMSVSLHGKDAEESQVIIDTTVQENNITYPTDGKLAIKIINHLHKIAKQESIQMRRTYMKEIKGHRISLPGIPLKRDTKYQKEQKREKFRRRAAIEPIIGHVKSDHRMKINYLKGFIGDEMNLLLAASAFNLKKWMNNFIQLIILLKLMLLTRALLQLNQEDKQKYDKLFLLLFRLC